MRSGKSYLSRDKLALMNKENLYKPESKLDEQMKSQLGSEAGKSRLSELKPVSIGPSVNKSKLEQIDE